MLLVLEIKKNYHHHHHKSLTRQGVAQINRISPFLLVLTSREACSQLRVSARNCSAQFAVLLQMDFPFSLWPMPYCPMPYCPVGNDTREPVINNRLRGSEDFGLNTVKFSRSTPLNVISLKRSPVITIDNFRDPPPPMSGIVQADLRVPPPPESFQNFFSDPLSGSLLRLIPPSVLLKIK